MTKGRIRVYPKTRAIDVLHIGRQVSSITAIELDDGGVLEILLALVHAQPYVRLADDVAVCIISRGIRVSCLKNLDSDDA